MDKFGICKQIEHDGFAIVPNVLTESEIASLGLECEKLPLVGRGGLRDLLQRVPAFQALPRHPAIRAIVETVLGPGAFAVRGILFDKSSESNWKVAWHQDLTIAVAARPAEPDSRLPGYGPWSVKEGVVHVQPPAELLAQMVAVRVHVDPCGPENGPLRVLAGSHRQGRLDRAEVEAWQARQPAVECLVGAGGALVMRPLLLHASSAAERPQRRRVIHLEFAAAALSKPLEWYEQWPTDPSGAAAAPLDHTRQIVEHARHILG